MKVLGIDVGGSKTEYIVMDLSSYRIIDRQRYSTPRTRKKVLDLLSSIVKLSINEYGIERIGLGLPGYIMNNKLMNAYNIALNNIALDKLKQISNGLPLIIENDANLFAYAEAMLGRGKNYRYIVGVIWGTGVGSGIIIDKKIYKGMGSAGELGYMVVPNGKTNDSGKNCIEAYSGGKYIVRNYHLMGGSKKIERVEQLLKLNNAKAKRVMDIAMEYMAIGIANIYNLLSPEIVIIGGGLSNIKGIEKELEKRTKKYLVKGIKPLIRKNLLGSSAGVIGAAIINNYPYAEPV